VCEDLNALYAKGNFTLSGLDWMDINEFAKKAKKSYYFCSQSTARYKKGDINCVFCVLLERLKMYDIAENVKKKYFLFHTLVIFLNF
jgi:hypothetical protein